MRDQADLDRLGVRDPADGYVSLDAEGVAVEELKGAGVYDRRDARIGSVDDVVVRDDGALEAVVVEVGGFLGLGAHTVAVDARRLGIQRGGDDVRVYLALTERELRDLPEHPDIVVPPAVVGFPR
jgi:sporulation protein YlmC with PRC-barrel domain